MANNQIRRRDVDAATWAKLNGDRGRRRQTVGEYLGLLRPPPLPLAITLTKLGGESLDAQDNLKAAFKGVADFLAAWVGTDDADPGILWLYGQEPGGPHGVRVEFRCLET
jgi:hypothetical protein